MSHDQFDRTNSIVIAWDRQIDIVRITVRIDQSQSGNAQSTSFADRIFFFVRVNNDHRLWQTVHRADTVQVPEHLSILAIQRRLHLFRVRLQLFAAANFFQLFQS